MLTVPQARMYAHYLDFKLYNPQGRLTPRIYSRVRKNRVKNKYWLDKLVSVGWASKSDKGTYYLASYKAVWKILGGTEDFYRINPDDLSDTDYIKELIGELLQRTADNKRRRIAKTVNKCGVKDFVSYGVRKAAELFGYKSPTTGSKYRSRYFSVLKSDRKVFRTTNKQYEENNCAEFMYKCDMIAL